MKTPETGNRKPETPYIERIYYIQVWNLVVQARILRLLYALKHDIYHQSWPTAAQTAPQTYDRREIRSSFR